MNIPSGAYVIMFVHHRDFQPGSQLPTFIVIGSFIERTYSANDHDIRIFFLYRFVDYFKSFFKHIGNQVLVSDSYIFQIEWFRMTCISSHFSPFGYFRVTVSPFYQVEDILHIDIHIAHRNSSVLSPMSRVLTRYSCSHNRKRSSSNILAKLEILEIS